MKYKIQSKSDFLTGSYLITRIPENEVDHNALYTIKKDCPEFILPFSYKNTDGQMEYVYKIGTLSKLQYFSGEFSPKEYVTLWQSLLKPLLECGDWFMNPCSFVLNAAYIYYDKKKKAVRYMYIPSACGCSGYDALHKMAVEISKMMTVSDSVLENKVLRTIIKDFNPMEFLQMLKDYMSESTAPKDTAPDIEQQKKENHQEEKNQTKMNELETPVQDMGEDIVIDLHPGKKTELIKKEREPGGYKIFSGRGKRKGAAQQNMPEENPKKPERTPLKRDYSALNIEKVITYCPSTTGKKQAEIIDITHNISVKLNGPGLRYIGRAQLPPAIKIPISEGEIFTIGRFDAAIGKKQSCFEFDKKTKAVSRRHAVIERDANGYKIVDLSSSAGTFVNDRKLPPNTPCGLQKGYRVSFGNSGADYVWEVS